MVDRQRDPSRKVSELDDINPITFFRRVISRTSQVKPIVDWVGSAQSQDGGEVRSSDVTTFLVVHFGKRKRGNKRKLIGNRFDVGKVQGVSCTRLKIGW